MRAVVLPERLRAAAEPEPGEHQSSSKPALDRATQPERAGVIHGDIRPALAEVAESSSSPERSSSRFAAPSVDEVDVSVSESLLPGGRLPVAGHEEA